jgi:predicted RNA-binding Zn ribbon-like protein
MLGEPLAVELMNTIWADRGGVHDALAGSADAAAWLRAMGPRMDAAIAPGLGAPDGADSARLGPRLRELRDALRRLAAHRTHDPRPAARTRGLDLGAAIAHLNAVAASAPSWSALSWPAEGAPTRATRFAGDAGDAFLSGIAESAIGLLGGDEPAELRACVAPGCVLYFVKDHPRREWCSAGCGNRARVARHYRRHHGGD